MDPFDPNTEGFKKVRNNENGNLIITLILVLLLTVGTMSLVYSTRFSQMTGRSQTRITLADIENMRYSISRIVENPVAMSQTIHSDLNSPADPAQPNLLRCISDPTYICPPGSHPLVLFAPQMGKWAVNTKQLASGKYFGFGLTNTGSCTDSECSQFFWTRRLCDDFPSVDADSCSYGFDTTWTPICTGGGACKQPQIEFGISLKVNKALGTDRSAINPGRFYTTRIL